MSLFADYRDLYIKFLIIIRSWGLAYNLMTDKLLQTNIFPSPVYDMRELLFRSLLFEATVI